MKRIIIIITIIICVLLIINDSSEYRIRIIANSNSTFDLIVKNECLSVVKTYIKKGYTKKDINFNKIKEEIQKISNKYNINITINTGMNKFPEKSLNGKIIPGGYFDSLVIKIGKAKGNNYFFILDNNLYDNEFVDVKVESYILNKLK